MPDKIEGIFTPTLVPLDASGEIHEAEYRRFVGWLMDKGVHGLYPNGSTGEFLRFTAEERDRITKMACEEARDRALVLAGAGEANMRETLATCERYAGYGARAVAIVSPFYYRLGPESVYAYFAEIARHSPIDVTLYNIPMFASPIDAPTLQRLAEFPRIVGIKDSSGDVAAMMRMIAAVRPHRPDFAFLAGWEAVLAPMMMIGCDGGTHASANVIPEIICEIFALSRAGRWEEATGRQYEILELFDAMLGAVEFPAGVRIAAELRGFRFGPGRQPVTESQQNVQAELRAVLRRVLARIQLD